MSLWTDARKILKDLKWLRIWRRAKERRIRFPCNYVIESGAFAGVPVHRIYDPGTDSDWATNYEEEKT